jgi:uncharacterized protein YegL
MDGKRRFGIMVGLLFLASLVFTGCGTEESDIGTEHGNRDGGSAPDGEIGDDDDAGEDPGESGSGGSGTGGSGGGGGTGGDPENVCAGTNVDPEPVEVEVEVEIPYTIEEPQPIAIYVMLDKSGSMEGAPWNSAVSSIKTFVNDPDSEHIDVALQYFPLSGHNDAVNCNGTGYQEPAVAMAALPGNAGAIETSLDNTTPNGGTPMEGALRGLVNFCKAYVPPADHPGQECVGVLITDGEPTWCDTSDANLTGVAGDAYANDDIRTFTVGMAGADFPLLHDMAWAGGTDCDGDNSNAFFACDVSSGMTLLQAFELIREYVTSVETRTETRTETTTMILECEWGIPDPPEGETFDRDMVNVVFSQPTVKDMIIGRVNQGKCDEVENGW